MQVRITIHDSIMTTPENIELIMSMIKTEFAAFGVTPTLHVTRYTEGLGGWGAESFFLEMWMKIALAVDDEGGKLAQDFASCRGVVVFELTGGKAGVREERRAALYVPLEAHPLLSLMEDCAVVFAAGYDAESLAAIEGMKLRPLVVSDGGLDVERIVCHLEGETLKVRAPVLHVHGEEE